MIKGGKRVLLGLSVAAALGVSAHVLFSASPPASVPQFQHWMYVWQTRWDGAVTAAAERAASSVNGFMALCGVADYEGTAFHFTPTQPAPVVGGKAVTFVCRVETGFSKAIDAGRTDEAAAFLADSLRVLPRTNGSINIQIDYDCPTRALAGYGLLLSALRRGMPEANLSITALPDWLNSGDMATLAGEAAYFVLQVHSLEKPVSADRLPKMCDPDKARGYAQRAAKLGRPFYIALPTHTGRMVFDQEGEFRLIQSEQSGPTLPPGWTARDVAADPAELAGLVRGWKDAPPDNCLGIAWFRLPVEGDRLNLPWPVVADVMAGTAPKADVIVELRRPEPGLYEAWVVNRGGYQPAGRVRFQVGWMPDAVQAYDVVGTFRPGVPHGRNSLTFVGRPPGAKGEEVMAAWFRMRPGHAGEKEGVQCVQVELID